MKYVSIAATTTLLAALIITVPASAQISNTGPGSTNVITDTSTTSCTSTSTNNVQVSNTTSQGSSSGSAASSGNTSSGSALSGNSSNSSTTSTSVVANNTSPCLPAVAVVTPTPPTAGKGGEVLAESTTKATPIVVASLPQTGSVTSADVAATTSATISGLLLLAYAARSLKLRSSE